MSTILRYIDALSEDLAWNGAVSVEFRKGAAYPWRLPYQALSNFPSPGLHDMARMPSGVRLSFVSDTCRVEGELSEAEQSMAPIDLLCDNGTARTAQLSGLTAFSFDNLPAGTKNIELWLPHYGQFGLKRLGIDADATIGKVIDTRPRWIAYGSSITQCCHAATPLCTWPALVARQLGLNLTNLGFGRECHLDPSMALLIGDLGADLVTLCVGVNIHGGSTMSRRTLQSSLIGFIRIIRDKLADTPIVVLSPIFSAREENHPNHLGLTLGDIRNCVEETVQDIQQLDLAIHMIKGLDLLGPSDDTLLIDGLHPSNAGYATIAERFVPIMKDLCRNNTAAQTCIDTQDSHFCKGATHGQRASF